MRRTDSRIVKVTPRTGQVFMFTLMEVLLISAVIWGIVSLFPMLLNPSTANTPKESGDVEQTIFQMMLTSDGRDLWIQRGLSHVVKMDIGTGTIKQVYRRSDLPIRGTLVSRDGSTSILSLDDRQILILKNDEPVISLLVQEGELREISLSANGQSAALLFDQTTIRYCDLSATDLTWVELRLREQGTRISLNPDGDQLVVSTIRNQLDLYDLKTRQCVGTLPGTMPLTTDPVFSDDGSCLAVTGYSAIAVYDTKTRERAWIYEDSTLDDIQFVALSPDGTRLAVSGCRSGIYIFDCAEGTRLHSWKPDPSVLRLAFSPSNDTLYAAANRTIQTWSLAGKVPTLETRKFH